MFCKWFRLVPHTFLYFIRKVYASCCMDVHGLNMGLQSINVVVQCVSKQFSFKFVTRDEHRKVPNSISYKIWTYRGKVEIMVGGTCGSFTVWSICYAYLYVCFYKWCYFVICVFYMFRACVFASLDMYFMKVFAYLNYVYFVRHVVPYSFLAHIPKCFMCSLHIIPCMFECLFYHCVWSDCCYNALLIIRKCFRMLQNQTFQVLLVFMHIYIFSLYIIQVSHVCFGLYCFYTFSIYGWAWWSNCVIHVCFVHTLLHNLAQVRLHALI